MYIDKGKYYQIDELKQYGIKALYTNIKFGDVLSFSKNELLEKLGEKNKILIAGKQTHSDNVKIIKSVETTYFENTDGFLTDRKDVIIFTKYADCLPIYFYDFQKKVIGLVHSGWQGTFKEIGTKTLEMMKKEYGCLTENIIIAFGIGISQKKYEVGIEFFNKFKEKFSADLIEGSFYKKGEKFYFDNENFNFLNFCKYGIDKNNIIRNIICSYENKNIFSYRRDNKNPSRNGAFIYFES